jgi:hypothetical protein
VHPTAVSTRTGGPCIVEYSHQSHLQYEYKYVLVLISPHVGELVGKPKLHTVPHSPRRGPFGGVGHTLAAGVLSMIPRPHAADAVSMEPIDNGRLMTGLARWALRYGDTVRIL